MEIMFRVNLGKFEIHKEIPKFNLDMSFWLKNKNLKFRRIQTKKRVRFENPFQFIFVIFRRM